MSDILDALDSLDRIEAAKIPALPHNPRLVFRGRKITTSAMRRIRAGCVQTDHTPKKRRPRLVLSGAIDEQINIREIAAMEHRSINQTIQILVKLGTITYYKLKEAIVSEKSFSETLGELVNGE